MKYYPNERDFLIQLARVDLNSIDSKKALNAISFMIDERMRNLHQPPLNWGRIGQLSLNHKLMNRLNRKKRNRPVNH